MRNKKTKVGLTKKSLDIRELIADKYPSYHPVLSLAEIAQDKRNEVNIRLQAHKEVAKYVCPQLKSIEIADRKVERILIIEDQSTVSSFNPDDVKKW